jgi:hypothetical protein
MALLYPNGLILLAGNGGANDLPIGGEAGIRTLGTAIQPYNGLANRRLKPLGHLSYPQLT